MKPGDRLGPYEVLGPLGSGGMGDVYRATDTALRRDVAIKVLPPDVASDLERRARFEREAQALAALNHPNIAQIYGFEKAGDRLAIVMELVEGEDLSARIARGPVPPTDALAIAGQIADALDAAHECGLVHRDLKPANVKVRDDGTVKVLDFGLVKALSQDSGSGVQDAASAPTIVSPATRLGAILGTAAYMAPEQAAGKVVDKRADVWGFGVVLYEMLTGRALFAADSVPETLAAVLRARIDLATLPAGTPRAIRRLLSYCLERQPSRRLRDIADARFYLESAAEPEVAPFTGRASRRTVLMGVAAAAFVASTAFLVGTFVGQRRAKSPLDIAFDQKTFDPMRITNARLGPDGQTILFSAATVGNAPELFVILPNTVAPTSIGPKNTQLLSVSRTGELAVLLNARLASRRQFVGTLATMKLNATPRPRIENVNDADWAPDGTMAIIREVDQQFQMEYPEGQPRYRIRGGYLSDVRVSPDGTAVAFFEHQTRGDDRGWVKLWTQAGLRELAGEYSAEEGLAWSVDGRSVLYSASKAGGVAIQPHIVNVAGRPEARQAVSSAGALFVQDVAADGRMLVVRDEARFSIRALIPGETAEREFPWLDVPAGGALSPDFRVLAFTDGSQSAGPNYQVAVRDVAGGYPTQMGEGSSFGVSPDGRWVGGVIDSTADIILYRTTTSEKLRVNRGAIERLTGRFFQRVQWWPGDEKHLLVCGSEKNKASRCYRLDLAGGAPQPVTPEGTSDAWFANDGKMIIAYAGPGRYQVQTIGSDSAQAARGLTDADVVLGWNAAPRLVAVDAGGLVPARIDEVDIVTGARSRVREIAPPDRTGLTSVFMHQWLDGGRGYTYTYSRELDTIYVVTSRPNR